MEFVKRIETLFRTGTTGGLTDAQLLERFLDRSGDEAQDAFATLVDRHGAMVLRVCRQILPTEEDAEDAAQAAFLVLARRAPSISRRESLACWLHGVARRVAANLRVAHTRRASSSTEKASCEPPATSSMEISTQSKTKMIGCDCTMSWDRCPAPSASRSSSATSTG